MKSKLFTIFLSILLVSIFINAKQIGADFSKYHNPDEINKIIIDLVKENKSISRLHEIAVTPGKNRIYIVEIGRQIKLTKKSDPGVLVTSNFSGLNVLSSEASLYLIRELLKDKAKRGEFTWYILPVGNPDAAWRFFKNPLYEDPGNGKAVNDDKDETTNEDGFEDLNGDGLITLMRVKDTEGQFIPVEGDKRLLKKADWIKGEKGIYKLYSEGVDNDRDGKYNEDNCILLCLDCHHNVTYQKWQGSPGAKK